MKLSRISLVPVLAMLALGGCQWGEEEDTMSGAAPPPAAAIAPVRSEAPLDEKLRRLEAELNAALQGELDDRAVARLYRAEAITDRLLETEPPFRWLEEGYALETRLKQAQAMADRVIAELRRGVRPQILLQDIERLRDHVALLRQAVEAGSGRPAPPPLDSLLGGGGESGG